MTIERIIGSVFSGMAFRAALYGAVGYVAYTAGQYVIGVMHTAQSAMVLP